VLDATGYRGFRLAACGYSLGATFRPSWMDVPPMIYSGNPMLGRPGMVLFLHAILVDAPNNRAMSLGHTVLMTDTGSESLSRFVPEFTLCQ
jgi:Xaa-Pro dipeptidase